MVKPAPRARSVGIIGRSGRGAAEVDGQSDASRYSIILSKLSALSLARGRCAISSVSGRETVC
jgi:hypothetical protein